MVIIQKITKIVIEKHERGRPLKFFAEEDTDPYFYCQRTGCGKLCKREEQNWIRFGLIEIRVCDHCYKKYFE